VTVRFESVENLVPNSQVLLDDVVVGTVTDIRVEDWHAAADLRLLESVPIARDARFTVGQKTLLGAQYVQVSSDTTQASAGAADLLEEGDDVPLARTDQAPGTEQVLAGVALLLNNGGLSQISTITDELTSALADRQLDARGLVTRSNELLAVLDETRGEIVRALDSLERLSRGLAEDRDVIARAIDQVGPGLAALEQERARLVDAVTTSGRASTRAVGVIQASQEAVLANLAALGPILSNLGKAATRLPEALKIAITIPFPAMTTEKTLRGDYSNLFATIAVTGGGLADLLFGQRDVERR
jgi:phospholipid/cholesterol/gamma-HCH transport system substrate-binding protein